MKIKFLGVGSQFSTMEYYHSNMLITAQSGKKMLVDCGSDARFSLSESRIGPNDIDAVYISHLHGDHIGGMEWMAFSTYFAQNSKKPKLFAEKSLMDDLWNYSLRGGLECIQGRSLILHLYLKIAKN
jgi:ribonuclease BN (tRNA processing enzyme)